MSQWVTDAAAVAGIVVVSIVVLVIVLDIGIER